MVGTGMTDGTTMLANRYQVGELIGRGGMAEVHIGYDTRLGRSVAIKILRPDLARDPSFQARFRREAQAAAGLNHPAIVAVYDTGEESVVGPAGERHVVPFIVMEYVEGHTVRDILKEGAAAPIDEAVEIVAGVLTGLEYAHAAGLVHRDIKPANIMLTPTGAVKVMDFGIARALADVGQTMTQAQSVIGTAQYLSPEQARGENVDARSDLYSAGCVLFELLCGRPPFIGDSPVSVAYQHVREPAPHPSEFAPDVPAALDAIVGRALAKDRNQRYSSAAEFLADLNAFEAGRPLGVATGQFPVGSATTGTGATAVLASQSLNPGATKLMPAVGGAGTPINPLDEYVEDDNSRWRKIRTIAILAGTSIAAALAVFALFTLTKGESPNASQVQVPNAVGLPQDQAVALIEGAGLQFSIERIPSEDVPIGTVVSTDPVATTTVERDSVVILSVSSGAEIIEIPDVHGLSNEDARAEIERVGLTVKEERQVDGEFTVPAGNAVGTDPPAHESVSPNSEVVLIISSGFQVVDNMAGMTREAAQTYLTSIQLPFTVEEVQTDEETPETVIGQNPGAGRVAFGTGIVLRVAIEVVKVAVPSVVGQDESAAVAAIHAAGLQTTVTYQTSGCGPNLKVKSTNPTGGTLVPQDSMVTVLVCKVPEPSPTAT